MAFSTSALANTCPRTPTQAVLLTPLAGADPRTPSSSTWALRMVRAMTSPFAAPPATRDPEASLERRSFFPLPASGFLSLNPMLRPLGQLIHASMSGKPYLSSWTGGRNSCYPYPAPHQSVLRGCRVLAQAHLYAGARYIVVGGLGPECSKRPKKRRSTGDLCTVLHMDF